MLDRIGRIDPSLKSYAAVMTDEAREAARAAERDIAAGKYRGPLHGVPIAVKDLCFTKGTRTMGGTAVRKDYGGTGAACNADDAMGRRARVDRCGRRSRGRRSGMAQHTRPPSRIAPGVTTGHGPPRSRAAPSSLRRTS
ncbi:MAG: hypothetical protein K2Y23_20170 [Cyanobacteria bacterium]|nr:hypothetical protein [Cyanobacteriota bacterium]